MERRRLGASGVEVSRLILGCGNFGGIGSAPEFFGRGDSDEEAFELMDAGWSLGLRTFDTADAYGGGRSELMIGKWIATTNQRPRLITKTFNPMDAGEDRGLSRARIRRQLESSLGRLGVDEVDVYLAHDFDPATPLEETVATFEELQQLGLIKAWGVSNFDATQLRRLFDVGEPALVQNAYSLLERRDEEEALPLCAERGIAYTPYGPLAGGLLAAKYRRGEAPPEGSRLALRPGPYEHLLDDETFAQLDRFVAAAADRGVSSSTLAVAWLLAQQSVTAVVVGPRRPVQLDEAVAALDIRLTAAEAEALAQLF